MLLKYPSLGFITILLSEFEYIFFIQVSLNAGFFIFIILDKYFYNYLLLWCYVYNVDG